jgi:hypothetical protein
MAFGRTQHRTFKSATADKKQTMLAILCIQIMIEV